MPGDKRKSFSEGEESSKRRLKREDAENEGEKEQPALSRISVLEAMSQSASSRESSPGEERLPTFTDVGPLPNIRPYTKSRARTDSSPRRLLSMQSIQSMQSMHKRNDKPTKKAFLDMMEAIYDDSDTIPNLRSDIHDSNVIMLEICTKLKTAVGSLDAKVKSLEERIEQLEKEKNDGCIE
jgi:hypothetical protein